MEYLDTAAAGDAAVFVHVFTAQDCHGDPQEAEEATPLWVPLAQVPFDRMWVDDRLWFPLMFAGRQFRGRFLFDGDTLLGHQLCLHP